MGYLWFATGTIGNFLAINLMVVGMLLCGFGLKLFDSAKGFLGAGIGAGMILVLFGGLRAEDVFIALVAGLLTGYFFSNALRFGVFIYSAVCAAGFVFFLTNNVLAGALIGVLFGFASIYIGSHYRHGLRALTALLGGQFIGGALFIVARGAVFGGMFHIPAIPLNINHCIIIGVIAGVIGCSLQYRQMYSALEEELEIQKNEANLARESK